MNYKFQVGDLVRVYQSDIGLVTARRHHHRLRHPRRLTERAVEYTILRGGITITAWEHELRKVNK